jgi:hypothetical protein
MHLCFLSLSQVNHLGHYLLTELLLERGAIRSGGRVINLSSRAHQRFQERSINYSQVPFRLIRSADLHHDVDCIFFFIWVPCASSVSSLGCFRLRPALLWMFQPAPSFADVGGVVGLRTNASINPGVCTTNASIHSGVSLCVRVCVCVRVWLY